MKVIAFIGALSALALGLVIGSLALRTAHVPSRTVIVGVDGEPELVVFINAAGQPVEIPFRLCALNSSCVRQLKQSMDSKKADVVNINTDDGADPGADT